LYGSPDGEFDFRFERATQEHEFGAIVFARLLRAAQHDVACLNNGKISMLPSRCLQSIDVLVLAGGLGTRIQSVLGSVPKLLAPVGGRPFLAHLLCWLQYFGARRVLLALGHGSELILDYVRTHPVPDLEIGTIVENELLGTAGAIRFARAQLSTDPVLIVNGDSFADADLCALLAQHRVAGPRATILCTEVVDAGRYGRVSLDSEGGIKAFIEKDVEFRGMALVNAGAYVLSASLLDDIATSQARSLEHDIFALMPAGSLSAFVGCFNFIDIGTPDSLDAAQSVLVSRFVTSDT
jgi:mannose-1-phosphate guanylyltransferase